VGEEILAADCYDVNRAEVVAGVYRHGLGPATVDEDVVSAATAVIGKGGTVVITGLADPAKLTVHVSGTDLTLNQKTIKGTLFGSMNPQYDIVRLLRLYDAGQLKLDELITNTYSLEDVNKGYQDLRDGKNIRGVIIHDK